jgi:predicted alpha/beta superfamily hydrolase
MALPVTGAGITGHLERYPDMPSAFVEPRNVDVWLPPGYAEQPEQRYAVLYMHDGQNVFDPRTSTLGVDWGVDETMTRLLGEGQVQPAIVVGVWCTARRFAEYAPRKALQLLVDPALAQSPTAAQGLLSDHYLRFLVEELKPFVDGIYRTQPDSAHTFILGSSMGALISLYALCEYPEVFGGAGAVSTHWPAGQGVMLHYLRRNLPDPRTHKIYFDFGTETLDAEYEPYQVQADALVTAAGYQPGRTWITRKFPGEDHSEHAWRKRVDLPLRFLLGNSA